MTVRGDLWAVCMVCTPIRDTFPTKGRRVPSQVFLMLPSACASRAPRWTGRVMSFFCALSFFFLSSLFFSPGFMCVAWRCSSWVISVVVWLSGRLCVHDVLWSRSAASIILIAPGPHPLVYLASHYASVSRQYSRLATRVSSPPSSPLRLPLPPSASASYPISVTPAPATLRVHRSPRRSAAAAVPADLTHRSPPTGHT